MDLQCAHSARTFMVFLFAAVACDHNEPVGPSDSKRTTANEPTGSSDSRGPAANEPIGPSRETTAANEPPSGSRWTTAASIQALDGIDYIWNLPDNKTNPVSQTWYWPTPAQGHTLTVTFGEGGSVAMYKYQQSTDFYYGRPVYTMIVFYPNASGVLQLWGDW